MLPAEQAAPLKLLEKGVSKEALAGLVLLEFPCELASAVLAGRWASSPKPFAPFMLGYKIRLVMAAAVTFVVSHSRLERLLGKNQLLILARLKGSAYLWLLQ